METRSVTDSIELPHPPKTVFEWLVTPSAICDWWQASRALVVAEPDGYWMAAWGTSPDTPDFVTAARLDVYEPPRRLRLGQTRYTTAAGPLPFPMHMTIEFSLEAVPSGTRLSVVQAGFPTDPAADPFYQGCVQGWRDTFASMARFAASQAG